MSLNMASQDMKKLRENAGLQEIELANMLKISTKTLVAIENNLPGTIESMDWLLRLKWKVNCEKNTFKKFKLVILETLDKKH